MKKITTKSLVFLAALFILCPLYANDPAPYWTINEYVQSFLKATPQETFAEGSEPVQGIKSVNKAFPNGHVRYSEWTVQTPQEMGAYLTDRLTDSRSGNMYLPIPKVQGDGPGSSRRLSGVLAKLFDVKNLKFEDQSGTKLTLNQGELELGERGGLSSSLKFKKVNDRQVLFTEFQQHLFKSKIINGGKFDFWIITEQKHPESLVRFSGQLIQPSGDGGFDSNESFRAVFKKAFKPFVKQRDRVAGIALKFLRRMK